MNRVQRIAAAGVVAAAAGMMLAAPAASAAGRYHRSPMHVMSLMAGEMHMERMAKWLKLSPEQLEQMRAAADAMRPRLRHALDALRTNGRRLHGSMRAEKFEPKELEEAAHAEGRAIADMIVVRTELQHRILAILTPEQRKRLEAMRGHRGWHRWHHGGGAARSWKGGRSDMQPGRPGRLD